MLSVLEIVADGSAGGGTTAVLGLCEDLRADPRFRVALVTQPASYAEAEGRKLGIEVHAFDFFTSRFDPRISLELRALVDRLKPDLIHVHGSRAAHAFTAGVFKNLATPLVCTVHGYHFINKSLPMKFLGWLAERRIARRMDFTAFVSHADRAKAARYGLLKHMKDSGVIYNGIDLDICTRLADTPKTHDLAFMARMHVQKNPLFMIDIMAELKADKYRLLMIGGGDLEQQARAYAIEKGVAAQIDFTGPLPHAEALKGMASAQVYVLPSLWEGLPIAPIEAMACGVPVVASHIGGTDEVVVSGTTGLLVKGFDARDYATAIRKIAGDTETRSRYGAQARQRAQAYFRRGANTEAYANLCRRMTAR